MVLGSRSRPQLSPQPRYPQPPMDTERGQNPCAGPLAGSEYPGGIGSGGTLWSCEMPTSSNLVTSRIYLWLRCIMIQCTPSPPRDTQPHPVMVLTDRPTPQRPLRLGIQTGSHVEGLKVDIWAPRTNKIDDLQETYRSISASLAYLPPMPKCT